MPWAVAGGALAAIGNGLVGNFSPTTSTGAWIGYQIVLGVGRGAGIQVVRFSQFLLKPKL